MLIFCLLRRTFVWPARTRYKSCNINILGDRESSAPSLKNDMPFYSNISQIVNESMSCHIFGLQKSTLHIYNKILVVYVYRQEKINLLWCPLKMLFLVLFFYYFFFYNNWWKLNMYEYSIFPCFLNLLLSIFIHFILFSDLIKTREKSRGGGAEG